MLNLGRWDAARILLLDSRPNDDEKSACLRRTQSVAYLSGTSPLRSASGAGA